MVIIQVTILGNGRCCDVINSPWPLLLFPNLCVPYHAFLGWVWRTNSFNQYMNTYWVTETVQVSGHNKKKVISVLLRWEESHRQSHPNKSPCCLILIVSLTDLQSPGKRETQTRISLSQTSCDFPCGRRFWLINDVDNITPRHVDLEWERKIPEWVSKSEWSCKWYSSMVSGSRFLPWVPALTLPHNGMWPGSISQ